jgi:hypothetical protein
MALGRPPGSTNKATAEVRAAIAEFASANVGSMTEWLNAVEDPGKRLDLYLRALEFYVPKLARTEVTGEDGGPLEGNLTVTFVKP